MRIGLIAVFLSCMLSGTNPGSTVHDREQAFADAGFFKKLDQMMPALSAKLSHDEFVVETATWKADSQELLVSARTTHKQGTLITVMGLPQSTMVDAFQISDDYTVSYNMRLEDSHAIPCQVIIKSAFAAELVDVENAPAGCDALFQISGSVAIDSSAPMANGWVTADVDGVEFTTIADINGRYDMEVYGASSDAFVTITAEGLVGNQESVVHVYSGNISSLLDAANSQARSWAKEIYGRRHGRNMLAAN